MIRKLAPWMIGAGLLLAGFVAQEFRHVRREAALQKQLSQTHEASVKAAREAVTRDLKDLNAREAGLKAQIGRLEVAARSAERATAEAKKEAGRAEAEHRRLVETATPEEAVEVARAMGYHPILARRPQ